MDQSQSFYLDGALIKNFLHIYCVPSVMLGDGVFLALMELTYSRETKGRMTNEVNKNS